MLSPLPDRSAPAGPFAIAAPGAGSLAMQLGALGGQGAGLDFAGLVSAALPPAAAPLSATPVLGSPDPAPLAVAVAETGPAASLPGGTILPEPGADLPPTPATAMPVDPRPMPTIAGIAVPPKRAAPVAGQQTLGAEPLPATTEPPRAPHDSAAILAPAPASGEDAAETDAAPIPTPVPVPGVTPDLFPQSAAAPAQPATDDPSLTEAEPAAAAPPHSLALPGEAVGPADRAPVAAALASFGPAPVVAAVAEPGDAAPAAPAALVPVSRPIRIPFAPPTRSADAARPAPVAQPGGPLPDSLPDSLPGSDPAAPLPRDPQAAAPTPAAALHTADAAAPATAPVPAPSSAPPAAPLDPTADRAEPRVAPQQEAAIAQVGELREALRAGRPAMTLTHAEFGLVSLRIEAAASPDHWRAVLASRDPGFVPAVQAALAERATAAASAASDGGGALLGQGGGQNGGQNGTGDHRYGASPNGGQGGSSPYLGQSGGRDGEAAPDHRRPSTAAALAARGEGDEPGSPAFRMSGMFA